MEVTQIEASVPACADWAIWTGREVEGPVDRGEPTVFIREYNVPVSNDHSILTNKGKIRRVWFCKEFTNWPLLQAVALEFDRVCVEVEPKNYGNLPMNIRRTARIYLKVAVPLKDGDIVCVGRPFYDESFAMGCGQKVTKEDYSQDRMLLPRKPKA